MNTLVSCKEQYVLAYACFFSYDLKYLHDMWSFVDSNSLCRNPIVYKSHYYTSVLRMGAMVKATKQRENQVKVKRQQLLELSKNTFVTYILAL